MIRILYPADERSMGPASDDVPRFLVFSPLVTYETDEEWYCGLGRPGLAERWEHSADYRTWTLYLRRDVRWHDGVPFTAHDVKFTLDLWRHPDVQHWGAGPVDSVVVIDDHTVRVTYKRPSRRLLNGWDVFYPKHLLEGLDPKRFWDWEFWTRPVGTGPFRYVRHTSKTMMEFEANPDHFRGKPRIDRLIVKWGGATPVMELLSGGVDAAYVSTVEAVRFAGDPCFRVRHNPLAGGVVVYWNHRLAFFRDAAVRRALTQAIDRRELQRAIQLPEGLPITDGVYTQCQFVRREIVPAWPHDPEEAVRLLDVAGWRDLDGDGVREREGHAFEFTVILPGNWLQAPQAAVYLQDQLRRVGVRMHVQILEGVQVVGDRLRAGDFDAAIWVMPSDHARLLGEGSPIGYRNPRVAELLRAAEVAMDLEDRDRIYRELAEIVRMDLPTTYLYPKVDTYVSTRAVGGVGDYDLLMHADRLWVGEESR